MPVVQIDMLEGRSLEQKRKMVKEITDALVRTINCEPDAVTIIVRNKQKEDLAEKGVLLVDR